MVVCRLVSGRDQWFDFVLDGNNVDENVQGMISRFADAVDGVDMKMVTKIYSRILIRGKWAEEWLRV